MEKNTVLKLIGMTFASMISLIILSIIWVAIYSYTIDPGHDQAYYEAYADVSTPWVASIGAFILFYIVTRFWMIAEYKNIATLVWAFPLTYAVIDLLILTIGNLVVWSEFYGIFLIAQAAKFGGSYLAWFTAKSKVNLNEAS